MDRKIYLDCHSTTPVAPPVLQEMLPWFSEQFGNAGSHSHHWGEVAREAVSQARQRVAAGLGARTDEIVFTSGATESNNLAILGVAEKRKRQGRRLISLRTEHPSVIAPLERLQRDDWEVIWADVHPNGHPLAGQVDLASLEAALNDETVLVSMAVANNEIGVIQPVKQIAAMVHQRGGWLHVDATQAVGWMPTNVVDWQADLVSLSGHKFYGPKGIGVLYVRNQETWKGARPVRLTARQIGGGQEQGWRSGTLNVPGIVGIGKAMELAAAQWDERQRTVRPLRDHLWEQLSGCAAVRLNGPPLTVETRLPNNLNFSVAGVEGQTIMANLPELAMSSGSACSSAEPGVSQVLTGIGLDPDLARCSLRLGLGTMHDREAIQWAADRLVQVIRSFT